MQHTENADTAKVRTTRHWTRIGYAEVTSTSVWCILVVDTKRPPYL